MMGREIIFFSPSMNEVTIVRESGSPKKDRERLWQQRRFRHLNLSSLPLFGRFKRVRNLDPALAGKLNDNSCDYKPFFTYWVTIVQVLVMLVNLFNYGVGTDFSKGLGVIERSGDVMTSSGSIAHIVTWEQNNVWIGPSFADLVHAGAKYTPCMRRDERIFGQILAERKEESAFTGCCVGDDGCFQTSSCPKQFARLIKWTDAPSASGQPTRAVCGQDPRYCINPRSMHPYLWGHEEISKWPICRESIRKQLISRKEKHMHCEITGRPCCIQMHGQCRITTKEYCDFVRGYFHPEAALCSQVSCLRDVCGMTPFVSDVIPDQMYRLITPLFIHAGLLRLLFTVVIQLTIMRHFELMIGWARLSTIYFVSGIGGYLASSIFVPYMPGVGPAGSQGGILGALIVNVIYNWEFLRQPKETLLWHVGIATILFITGFLPYVDNWAQLFGFIFGCMLATGLIPYIGSCARRFRIQVISFGLTFIILLALFVIFHTCPMLNLNVLSLFNCPFPGKVCDQQSLILRSWLPI